jgi:hypothetical protein
MMKIFAALMVLIAFSAGAQACWVPPTKTVDDSTSETEPVKVVEPVDTTTEEEETDDSSTDEETEDSSTNDETEVTTPVVDNADETTAEEPEVVETPVAETPVTETENEIEVKVGSSTGYGEAHIVKTTTTGTAKVDDGISLPVETEPVVLAPVSSNSAVDQNDDSNVTAANTASNNGSHVPVTIALIIASLIAVAIYYIRK